MKGSLDLDLKGINSSIQTVSSIENLAECMTSKYSPDRTLASNSRNYFYLIRRFDNNKDTAEIKFNQSLPDELLLRLKEIITSEGIWSSKFKYIQLWQILLNMWALKLISDDKSSLIYTDYCTYRVAHLISHMSRIKVEKDSVCLNDREFKVKTELLEEIIDKMFRLLDTEMVQRRDPVSESDLLLNIVDSRGTQLIFTPEYTEAVRNLKRPLEALMNTVLI
jgi:hypothetical protein